MGLSPGKSWICEAIIEKEKVEDRLEHAELVKLTVVLPMEVE